MYPDSDVVVDLFMSQAIRKLCFKTSSLSCKFGSLTLQLVTKVRSILFSVVLSATVCTKIAHDFSLFWVMLDLWYALMQWMENCCYSISEERTHWLFMYIYMMVGSITCNYM
jgi:hypothetical protein